MTARWWLPPWWVRPAVAEEPAAELAFECHDLTKELDEVYPQLKQVRKQRDNALARGDVAELGQRAALADLETASKKRAELQAYVHDLENRSESDEAKAWKRQAEQDRANCQTLTDQLKELRDVNQLLELELLWVTDPAFVDEKGAEKVRGASS